MCDHKWMTFGYDSGGNFRVCSCCKKKVYTKTNGDYIRIMTDEELAEFLTTSPEMEFEVCRYCNYFNSVPDDRGGCLNTMGLCNANARAEALKKWLKQPKEEA